MGGGGEVSAGVRGVELRWFGRGICAASPEGDQWLAEVGEQNGIYNSSFTVLSTLEHVVGTRPPCPPANTGAIRQHTAHAPSPQMPTTPMAKPIPPTTVLTASIHC